MQMKKIILETTFDPPHDHLEAVNNGLHEFNLAQLGERLIYNYFKVLVIAKAQDGSVVGGIHGNMGWDWLHIDTSWVDEKYRRQGIGSNLLKQVEKAAISKGFIGSHLETTEFQAVDFYIENGYEVFGALEGKPKGHTWFYMKKRLLADRLLKSSSEYE